MNQKVIINQLHKLLDHLAQQVKRSGNPRLKKMSFQRPLFKHSHPLLSGYLDECRASLASLEQDAHSATVKTWQLEHLVEQCQALEKVLNSLPIDRKAATTQQEQLAGYERRLLEMVAELEEKVATATGFQEQQQFLLTLDITRQRLERCQTAQKDYSWKKLSRSSR